LGVANRSSIIIGGVVGLPGWLTHGCGMLETIPPSKPLPEGEGVLRSRRAVLLGT
jgi:hypothetical protein